MKLEIENRRGVITLIVIAVIFLLAPNMSAHRKKGGSIITGDEVTILVTARPHNDHAREIAILRE